MRSSSTPTAAQPAAGDTLNLRWAVKRAALGLVILAIVVTGMAFLLYASLDQEAEARESALSQSIARQ